MTTAGSRSLFLSRLLLDLRSRQVRSELAQPYEMHRTLMRAFGNVPESERANARERFGVLFRADPDERGERLTVYVQSLSRPDWSYLALLSDYLWRDADQPNPACKDIAGPYDKLQNGQVLAFRLRANPTKRVAKDKKRDGGLDGKRVGLLREEEQIDWLVRKGQEREKGKRGGFEIVTKEVAGPKGVKQTIHCVKVTHEGVSEGRKGGDAKSQKMLHLAVRFEGLLRITDADAFRETIVRGIGSAKAFGFGLLSLGSIQSASIARTA